MTSGSSFREGILVFTEASHVLGGIAGYLKTMKMEETLSNLKEFTIH